MVDSTKAGVKYLYVTIVHLLLNWMSGCLDVSASSALLQRFNGIIHVKMPSKAQGSEWYLRYAYI